VLRAVDVKANQGHALVVRVRPPNRRFVALFLGVGLRDEFRGDIEKAGAQTEID
jgi:hypothetical protein